MGLVSWSFDWFDEVGCMTGWLIDSDGCDDDNDVNDDDDDFSITAIWTYIDNYYAFVIVAILLISLKFSCFLSFFFSPFFPCVFIVNVSGERKIMFDQSDSAMVKTISMDGNLFAITS